MRVAQLPQFVTVMLSVAAGAATVLQALRVQTGMYGYTSPAALTLSLATVAVAVGALVAGWALASQNARSMR